MAQDRILKHLFRKLDNNGNIIITNPEKMQYLLLIFYSDEEEKTFEIITGRTNLIDFLEENIEDIDIQRSFLLDETTTLENFIPMKKFLTDIVTEKLASDNQCNTFKGVLEELSEN